MRVPTALGLALGLLACSPPPAAPLAIGPSATASAAPGPSAAPSTRVVPAGCPTAGATASPSASPPASPSAVPTGPPPATPTALPAALDAAARTYACREGQVVIPTEARAPDGLPLPGALALGVQAEQLPMLRGLTARPLPFQRRLLGDARLPTGGTALVYELGGATAVVITSPPIDPGGQPGADAPIVVGARVVVPGGLTTEQARAWLAAMAPCRPLPALDDETGTFYNGLWRRPNDVPAVEPKHGYFADALELNASTVDDDAWRQAGEFITRDLFTPNAPLPILPTAGPVPACRWVGVQAFGLIYGK